MLVLLGLSLCIDAILKPSGKNAFSDRFFIKVGAALLISVYFLIIAKIALNISDSLAFYFLKGESGNP
ncbi:MAG: hypothetical protein IPI88_16260 [Chitinophagaceae bacterium]|nr:hypothetical protein [Chitinophagaceae bacterium]